MTEADNSRSRKGGAAPMFSMPTRRNSSSLSLHKKFVQSPSPEKRTSASSLANFFEAEQIPTRRKAVAKPKMVGECPYNTSKAKQMYSFSKSSRFPAFKG
jgi:hypothetical protein